jgi:L-asparaginase
MKPVLVIHGGAGSKIRSLEQHRELTRSLESILNLAYPILLKGGSSLEAVHRAVMALEDDSLYNAGKGSKIQSDGQIRMSASIMDGKRRRFAGCMNVEDLKNPIRLARALLNEPDRVLSGEGARQMAKKLKLPLASPFTDHQIAAYKARRRGKSGTVGAVAVDTQGRLAAATSTGGRGFEFPFRVSDSPTIAGNFANRHCAVSATGHGEQIVECAVASTICRQIESGARLETAVAKLLKDARREGGDFGLIAVDRRGHICTSTNTACLIWASADQSGYSYFR